MLRAARFQLFSASASVFLPGWCPCTVSVHQVWCSRSVDFGEEMLQCCSCGVTFCSNCSGYQLLSCNICEDLACEQCTTYGPLWELSGICNECEVTRDDHGEEDDGEDVENDEHSHQVLPLDAAVLVSNQHPWGQLPSAV